MRYRSGASDFGQPDARGYRVLAQRLEIVAALFLRRPDRLMRALAAALICVALLPATVGQPRRDPPTQQADTVTLREVRRAAESPFSAHLADSPDTLVVERPFRARPGATAGVFVVGRDGVLLRRAVVTYGRASGPLIQILNGASPAGRLIVSDMSAWDAFDGLQLRW